MPRFVAETIPGFHMSIEMPVVAQAGMTFGAQKPVMRTTHVKGETIINYDALESVILSGGLDDDEVAKGSPKTVAENKIDSSEINGSLTKEQVNSAVSGVVPDTVIVTSKSSASTKNGELSAADRRSKALKLQRDVARLRNQQAGMSSSAAASLIPQNTFLPDEEEIALVESDAEESEKW